MAASNDDLSDDWANLPADIFSLIARRLDVTSAVRLAACSQTLYGHVSYSMNLNHWDGPCLLMPDSARWHYDESSAHDTVYDVVPLDHPRPTVIMPFMDNRFWVGMNGDWIAVVDLSGTWFLTNVYTHQQIPLPSLVTCNIWREELHGVVTMPPERIASGTNKSLPILEDIVHHTLSTLHIIDESLLYWQQYTYKGQDLQKIYYMVLKRGPRQFAETVLHTLARCQPNGKPLKYLIDTASAMVTSHLKVLTMVQRCVATFLAEVYTAADEHREGLTGNSDTSLRTLCLVLNTIFPKLEAAIASGEPIFTRLPEVNAGSPDWSAVSTDAILLIYANLQLLENTVSSLISSHVKPSNVAIYWLPYTCGAVGLSACSLWLLSHSSYMGSSDISNWLQEAKESMTGFWAQRVEEPIISIRDEVVRTLNQGDRLAATEQEVKFTEEALHRMLVAFCEETSIEKPPHGTPVQVMLEIVLKRYEEESKHPIFNLFCGDIARAMLIQIQKLKLDFKEAMLEMDHILNANRINFAILAALPLIGLSGMLLLLVRAVIRQVNRRIAVRRSRNARRLLNDIDRLLNEFEKEGERWQFGLAVYSIDRLYGAIELVAKETEEWNNVSEDLFALTKVKPGKKSRALILGRLKDSYECLQKPLPTD